MKRKLKKLLCHIMLILTIFQATPVHAWDIFSDILPFEEIKKALVLQNKGATIIEELVEKRETNSKSFLMSDGTIMYALYGETIHYEENGKLLDINNTLEAVTTKEGIVLRNKNNDFITSFSEDSSKEKLVLIEKDTHKLEWKLKDSKNKKVIKQNQSQAKSNGKIKERTILKNASSSLTYEGILNSTDLNYTLTGKKLKESIIINDREGIQNEYVFELTTDLEAIINKDNSITFKDSKEVVFIIESPYMFDGNMDFSSDVEIKINETTSGYELIIIPSQKWLRESSRRFPITIDPTISTDFDRDYITDTYIYSGDGNNTTKWQANILRIGSSGMSGVNKNPVRSLVKFQSLPQINSGDQVIAAYFDLISVPSGSSVVTGGWTPPTRNIQLNIHNVTVDWMAQDAFWSNMNDKYNPKIVDYSIYNFPTYGGYHTYRFDITSIAKDWYITGNNYGLMIKENTEVSNFYEGDAYFFSSDVSTTYTYCRPSAIIIYRNQTGIEDYMTYHSYDAGRAGTLYTNDYNGNLVLVHDDVATPGSKFSVSISHVYNANDKAYDLSFGNGFRLNLNETIEPRTIANSQYTNYLIYIDEDATRHYFYQSDDIWKDEDGLNLTLTMNNNVYTMKDKYGNKKTFIELYNKWYLKTIEDTNGNVITINHNPSNYYQITSVTDAAGDTINLTYASNHLYSIEDVNNRHTYYNYTNNNLTSITYSDNKTSYYVYDSINKLTSAKNVDNLHIDLEYYDVKPYRIKKILEYSTSNSLGKTLSMKYGENATSFTDNNNKTTNYNFNNIGNTLSVTNLESATEPTNAYGSSANYITIGDNVNKISSTSGLVKSTTNLLVNSSAESDMNNWSVSQWGNNNGIVTVDTVSPYYGNKSFKIATTTKINTEPLLYQFLALKPNTTYTLSAYIKGNIEDVSTVNDGAMMAIHYINSNNVGVEESTKVDVTNIYERYTFTFTTFNVTDFSIIFKLKNAKGTIYLDNVQLEEGPIANHYNFVDNSSFNSSTNSWNSYQLGDGCGVVNYFGNNSYVITGAVGVNKFLYQEINVNGNKGDSFMVDAWALSDGINKPSYQVDIPIKITGINGEEQWVIIDVNPNTNFWQYVSKTFVTDFNYKMITVYLRSNGNVNTAYFDNIGLYKDVSGNSYTYDNNGNVMSTKDLTKQNSSFTYDSKNQLILATSPKGRSFTYEYDSAFRNRLLKATTEAGINYNFTYDSFGNPLSSKITNSVDNQFIERKVEYLSNGNYLTKQYDQRDNVTETTYNTITGTISKTKDTNNNEINYQYDGLDRLTNVNSGNTTNSYTYVNDRLNTINHNDISYSFVYDVFGNMISTKIGNQALITNTYEANNGNLTKSTYGNGQETSYTYDPFNRVSNKTNSVGITKYIYDNRGNLGKLETKNTQGNIINGSTYAYDLSDRLTRYQENSNYTVDYKYDNYSNVSSKICRLNNVTKTSNYTYDLDNKITDINNIKYSYDSLERFSTRKIGNTYQTKYNYLDINSTKTTTLIESIENGNNNISYTYDNLGNVEIVKENNVLVNEYEYDYLNQLIDDKDYKHDKKYEYLYDTAGNILSKKEYELSTNALTNTINYQYNNSNWNDQLTSYNGKTISYDAIGNPLSYDNMTFEWQNGRELKKITKGTDIYQYKYNDSGIRTEKTINSVATKYYVEGTDIIFEDRNGSIIYYNYDASGVSGFEYNNNTYYFVKNLQGDVIEIIDSNYETVAKYEYSSWGEIISITDGQGNDVSGNISHVANVNPFRYRSYYYDSETRLYYLNSRYYNPEWSRFINADGIIGANQDLLSYNLYAYVSNNPVNFDDPSGEGIFDILNGVKDGFIGTFTGIANTVMHPIKTAKAVVSDPFNTIKTAVLNTIDPFKTSQIVYNLAKGDHYGAGALYGNNLGTATVVGAGMVAGNLISKMSCPTQPLSVQGITGYTKHGINSAIGHNGRGIQPSSILDTMKNPTSVVYQTNGAIKFTGSQGVVVINQSGKVITTWATSSKYIRGN